MAIVAIPQLVSYFKYFNVKQERKKNCVLEGQAMVPTHGAKWVCLNMGYTWYGISIQWQFHRNNDDKTWDLGFFSDKTITPYYSIYSKYSCDCDPPPEMYRCIMNYTYNLKERGSAVRTLIDERKMTFLWICSLYDRGLTFWSSQAHISDVVLVGPATMGLEAKKRRGCRFMKDTKAVQKC